MNVVQMPVPARVGLTDRQIAAYEFVKARVQAGTSPTYDEIGEHIGMLKSGAHRIVGCLIERGWLIQLPNRARSLALPAVPARGLKPNLRIVAEDDSADPIRPVLVDLPESLLKGIVMQASKERCSTHQVIADAIAVFVGSPPCQHFSRPSDARKNA